VSLTSERRMSKSVKIAISTSFWATPGKVTSNINATEGKPKIFTDWATLSYEHSLSYSETAESKSDWSDRRVENSLEQSSCPSLLLMQLL
jgi:hypothetical protein